jgi:hypothetical protein
MLLASSGKPYFFTKGKTATLVGAKTKKARSKSELITIFL